MSFRWTSHFFAGNLLCSLHGVIALLLSEKNSSSTSTTYKNFQKRSRNNQSTSFFKSKTYLRRFLYTKRLFLSFCICENKYLAQKYGTFNLKNHFLLLSNEIEVRLNRYNGDNKTCRLPFITTWWPRSIELDKLLWQPLAEVTLPPHTSFRITHESAVTMRILVFRETIKRFLLWTLWDMQKPN
jgi:hypothetical protein